MFQKNNFHFMRTIFNRMTVETLLINMLSKIKIKLNHKIILNLDQVLSKSIRLKVN